MSTIDSMFEKLDRASRSGSHLIYVKEDANGTEIETAGKYNLCARWRLKNQTYVLYRHEEVANKVDALVAAKLTSYLAEEKENSKRIILSTPNKLYKQRVLNHDVKKEYKAILERLYTRLSKNGEQTANLVRAEKTVGDLPRIIVAPIMNIPFSPSWASTIVGTPRSVWSDTSSNFSQPSTPSVEDEPIVVLPFNSQRYFSENYKDPSALFIPEFHHNQWKLLLKLCKSAEEMDFVVAALVRNIQRIPETDKDQTRRDKFVSIFSQGQEEYQRRRNEERGSVLYSNKWKPKI